MPKVQDAVRTVVAALVSKQYGMVERLTKGIRLPEEQVRRAIEDYGRTLVLPPDHAFDNLDIVAVTDVKPHQWSVRMHLWTAEEGQSDLSVELTLKEAGDDFLVELDDLHVL